MKNICTLSYMYINMERRVGFARFHFIFDKKFLGERLFFWDRQFKKSLGTRNTDANLLPPGHLIMYFFHF